MTYRPKYPNFYNFGILENDILLKSRWYNGEYIKDMSLKHVDNIINYIKKKYKQKDGTIVIPEVLLKTFVILKIIQQLKQTHGDKPNEFYKTWKKGFKYEQACYYLLTIDRRLTPAITLGDSYERGALFVRQEDEMRGYRGTRKTSMGEEYEYDGYFYEDFH